MERYRELVDDWERFSDCRGREPLTAVRRNPLKAGEGFSEELEAEFRGAERAGWNGRIYRLRGVEKPGLSPMHWRGEYYVQEESAAVPVSLMEVGSGDSVLDLCAAPGGKTTQLAARLGNWGCVVANDPSDSRRKSLNANIYRTGSASAVTAAYDGRNFPASSFDSVLVDAPCSGEGDRMARNAGAADLEESEDLSRLQADLLKRASELLAPGGELVYSTCTISPLENEAVVSEILGATDLRLENLEPEFPYQRGENSFMGEDYGPELEKTVRVLPHHLESGVIFAAKFRKG